eukprot:c7993_g1_i5.p1 GENE.c7993_g1_i5~~c7993_g1_i5.p1  ORF type:complete len:127 (+),score=17.32 c7993_g1_i5:321-701(+)
MQVQGNLNLINPLQHQFLLVFITLSSCGPELRAIPTAVHTTFSFVHTIENDSPAYKAGLRVHDEIISFGHISSAKHFQDIASLVKDKEGQSIPVKVLREGQVINLSLTPARWQGKGLLGCHILVNQ